jgi:hypothetical protein
VSSIRSLADLVTTPFYFRAIGLPATLAACTSPASVLAPAPGTAQSAVES